MDNFEGDIMQLKTGHKDKIKKILKEHNIKRAGVFGSYAKNEANDDSDLDLIVELSKNDLFGLISLKQDLEEELNLSVDIITYNGLIKFSRKERFKEEVLKEQEIIL